MISRKLILLSVSVSMVNLIVSARLLKALQTVCMSVESSLYKIRISSTHLKYPNIQQCVNISKILVRSDIEGKFQKELLRWEHPQPILCFEYSTGFGTRSNSDLK